MALLKLKWAVAVTALALVGCGSGGDDDNRSQSSPVVTQSSVQTSSVDPAISSSSNASLLSSSSTVSVVTSSLSIDNSSSSSLSSTSSSEAAQDARVEYLYPPQGAHFGGANSTLDAVELRVKSTINNGIVNAVTLNGQAMTWDVDRWVSSGPIDIAEDEDSQAFSVQVTASGDTYEANSLVINNAGLSGIITKAGETRVGAVTGVSPAADGFIYFTDAYDGKLFKYDPVSAESEIIYEGEPSNRAVEDVFWPVSVVNETIYLLQDSYAADDAIGSGQYTINLVIVNEEGTITRYENVGEEGDVGGIGSTKGIIVDLDSNAPISGFNSNSRIPSIYSADFVAQSSFQQWFLDFNDIGVFNKAVSLNPESVESRLGPSLGVLAFTGHLDGNDSTFSIIRQSNSSDLDGKSSLIEITTFASNNTTRANSRKVAELDYTLKPSAMLYSLDGTELYIADTGRIWKLDTSNYAETLVSSSNIKPVYIGTGPLLGGKISAMAWHPDMPNYMYVATGEYLLLVNVDTGDRIAVIK